MEGREGNCFCLASLSPRCAFRCNSLDGRTDLRFGYGLPAFGGRYVATPEAGVGIAPDGRDFRIGWRLGRAARKGAPLELEAEATRRETGGAGPGAGEAVNGVGLRMVTQW